MYLPKGLTIVKKKKVIVQIFLRGHMECEITLSEIDQIQHRRFSTDLMTRKDRL